MTKVHLELNSWNPEVKEAVNAFVDDCGNRSRQYDPSVYVVSDSDNTISIFDVEHALAAFQLQAMAFCITPAELNEILLTDLSDPDAGRTGFTLDAKPHSYREWAADITNAYQYLYQTYGPFTAAGFQESEWDIVHADPYWLEFAAKMRAMYALVSQEEGTVSCPWLLYWFTSMTEEEVYALAFRSHAFFARKETSFVNWTSPEGIESKLGQASFTWIEGISVTENIRELFEVLHNNGIHIWVCSASGMEPIKAEMDYFGLHPYIDGLLAMTIQTKNGKYIPAYDFSGTAAIADKDGSWTKDSLCVNAMTQAEGKVRAIENVIEKRHGHGPAAAFGDSNGDFLMCTLYDTLRLVICFNRADRSVFDGGSLLAEAAVHQADHLKENYQSCRIKKDTQYVLQGRDENHLRTLIPERKTVRAGETVSKLWKDRENSHIYEKMKNMDLKQLLATFARKTENYGFLENYDGYHSRH